MNLVLLQTTAAVAQKPLPTPQLVLALALAISVLVIVVELVRRQKLREEYAFLWMGTAALLMVLAVDIDILVWLSNLVSAESPSSVLFFGALVFLLLIALQFSVRLTKLTFRNKTLSQRVALLEQSLEELSKQAKASDQESDQAPTEEPVVPLPTRDPQTQTTSRKAADPRPNPTP
ncbi:MAG: DUF2304 family protein [Planctomycetota bacterium]|nr:DUF2304 family protein [Planctomycetota bacterium]